MNTTSGVPENKGLVSLTGYLDERRQQDDYTDSFVALRSQKFPFEIGKFR